MAHGDDTGTLTATGDGGAADRAARRPHLFLVLHAHRPLVSPVRIALADVAEVTFGRAPARSVTPEVDEEGRRIDVRIDDRRMSSRHARLTRVLGRWSIEDSGSKNGTLVNGSAEPDAELADRDLLELGETFFLFREALPCEPGAPAVLDAATLAAPAPGLATLLPALGRDFDRLAAMARSPVSITLEGETGTGKEVLARAVHALSGRGGPFVAVNCGALARDLVEGELFGHRRGAFSGATEDRPGLVRAADKGTLFLDEIGDLPASAQAVLLRVLQEREVRPIGGTSPVRVDVRVIAATHRDLDRMVAAGDFRADLLARLAGYRFSIPPLRDRMEDLGLLLGDLLGRVRSPGASALAFQPRAARALLRYGWPGNIRELEQCLSSAVVLASEAKQGQIALEHLPAAVQRALQGEDALRDALIAHLSAEEGNLTAVAEKMGKGRTQIQRWIKRYGIDAERFRRKRR